MDENRRRIFELYGRSSTVWRRASSPSRPPALCRRRRCGATTCARDRRHLRARRRRTTTSSSLTVDYIEKMCAVGRIPGGYLKREAKPSDHGTLEARMVDRPIRPGFADGCQERRCTSCAHRRSSSTASTRPTPSASCRRTLRRCMRGRALPSTAPPPACASAATCETGEFIVNPTVRGVENSDLELTIAGTGRLHLHEWRPAPTRSPKRTCCAAMTFGQEAIAAFCEAQQAPSLDQANIEPMVEWPVHVCRPGHRRARRARSWPRCPPALRDADKLSRMQQGGRAQGPHHREEQFSDEERAAWKERHRRRAQGAREEGHARHGHRDGRARRRPHVPRTSARCTSCRATCPACTARACSSAARRRRSPSARSAC
ncbi:MAG: hypothetical protein ACLTDR_07020 [Adlercreutzia equolifaciens]